LSFTVFGYSSSNTNRYCTLIIYGDGVELYSNKAIADNGRPFDVTVDVTGVTDLKIYMQLSIYNSPGFGIGHVTLQRTAK